MFGYYICFDMPPKKDAKKTAPKKKTTDKKTNDKKKPLQKQKQNVNVNVTVNASGGSGGGGGKGGSSSGGGGGSKSNKPPPAPPKDKNKELATILGLALKANAQQERVREYNKPPPAFTNIPSAAAPPPRAPPVAPAMSVDPDDPVPAPPAPARPAARPAPARPAPIFQPIAAPRALLPPPRMIIEEPDDNEGGWAGGNPLMLEDGEVDDEYEDWEPPTRRESPILETTTLYKPPEMDKGFSHKNLTERMPTKPGVVTRAMSVEMEPTRPLSLEKPPSSLMERVSKRRVITPPASPPQPMLLSAEERRLIEEEEPPQWLGTDELRSLEDEPQIIGGNTPVDRSPPPMPPPWFRARVPPPPPAGPKPDGDNDGEGDIFKPRRGRPPKDKEDQTLTEYELLGKITNLSRMTPETFQSLPERELKLDDFKVDVLKRLYAIHKVDNITSKKPTKNDYILGMGKTPYIRPSQKKA